MPASGYSTEANATGTAGHGPLSGLLFLDCGQFLAGPVVSLYAAALGARVIKIEKPLRGDDSREIGPHCDVSGESSYFMSVNRGKESLTLDLSSEQGKEVFYQLAQKCDVLVFKLQAAVSCRASGWTMIHSKN